MIKGIERRLQKLEDKQPPIDEPHPRTWFSGLTQKPGESVADYEARCDRKMAEKPRPANWNRSFYKDGRL